MKPAEKQRGVAGWILGVFGPPGDPHGAIDEEALCRERSVQLRQRCEVQTLLRRRQMNGVYC
jgi:hypothetical protein